MVVVEIDESILVGGRKRLIASISDWDWDREGDVWVKAAVGGQKRQGRCVVRRLESARRRRRRRIGRVKGLWRIPILDREALVVLVVVSGRGRGLGLVVMILWILRLGLIEVRLILGMLARVLGIFRDCSRSCILSCPHLLGGGSVEGRSLGRTRKGIIFRKVMRSLRSS